MHFFFIYNIKIYNINYINIYMLFLLFYYLTYELQLSITFFFLNFKLHRKALPRDLSLTISLSISHRNIAELIFV